MRVFATKFALLFFVYLCSGGVANAQLPGFDELVAGDEAVGLAAGDQSAPAGSNGNGTQLLVWADNRSNPYIFYEYETANDIYGVRIDANGNMLDAVPFPISAARASQTNPKVAWNGENWLVVFETYSLSGTGYYYGKALAVVRVAPNGSVLDSDPIPLHGLTPGSISKWDVASDGNQWVVVAEGNGISTDLFAIRIAANGTVLDPPNLSLVEGEYYTRFGIRLAFAGGVFLLTFDEQAETAALRFDGDLNLLDPQPYILLDQVISDLNSNGSDFYVVWNHQRPDSSMVVSGSRVSPAGVMLDLDQDGNGVEISGDFPSQGFDGGIAVAWDGANWRVTWSNDGSARVARVNPSGQVTEPGGAALAGVLAGISTGTDAQGLQLTWTEFNNNEYDVFGASIGINNEVLANQGISLGTPRQNRSDIAAGASGYMAVYRSALANQVRILAQPLNASGGSLMPEPVQLDAGTMTSGPGSPAVAWNGSHYMVSWSSPAGVVAKRILQNGTVLDAAPIVVMNPAHGAVDIAALGDDFLVAAMRFSTSVHFALPIASRVSGSGVVLDTEPAVLGAYYVRTIAVSTLDGKWLVAWHRNVSHDDPIAETRGALINPDGSIADTFPIHGYFSTTGGNAIFTIGLASDGNRALMVQSQELTSGVETDLLAHLVNADGTVEPMTNLTPWIGNQYRPEISFDGRDFMLVYQDQRSRVAAHTLDQLDARSDIYGMRIKPDGTVLDPQGFLVSNSSFGETDPTVASLGGNTLIMASQVLNDGVHASYRALISEALDGSNRFPVAVANASTIAGDVPLTVDFSSSGSVDPEGSALTYLWQFADGGSSGVADPSHEYTVPGEYPAVLTIFDNLGQPASQAITIGVSAPNQLPIAVASASQLSGPVPLSTILYADGSYDPDGQTGNTEWRHNGNLLSYNATAYVTFSNEGVYDVVLRVYDNRGDYGEDTITITATAAETNLPPTAAASATPSNGDAPLNVAFSSAGSNDPDGSIVTYLWDFGDGTNGTGANPSHLYTSIGTYNVILTVTDNSGDSDTASVTVTVNAVSAASLRSNITMSSSSKRGVSSVKAVVLVTNGQGGAERSAIVNGKWT